MKPGSRILGIDDAAFEFEDEQTFLTGVVYRGTEFIEDIETVPIKVDGNDSTEKVIELYEKCNNPGQIKAVILDGVSFAGFNIVEIEEVNSQIGKPVIVSTANKPDRKDFRQTMERTGNYDERFERLGEPEEVELKDGSAYIQYSGTDFSKASEIVRDSVIHGQTPEPVRVAHMIGRAFR